MSDRLNHNSNTTNIKHKDYSNEMKLLSSMEFAHQRKKAAFDELLRYTYSNLKQTPDSSFDKQP